MRLTGSEMENYFRKKASFQTLTLTKAITCCLTTKSFLKEQIGKSQLWFDAVFGVDYCHLIPTALYEPQIYT